MQSFKTIYSVIMKLNRFFALHFFANDLYYITETFSHHTDIIYTLVCFESFILKIQTTYFCSIFVCTFEADIAFGGGYIYLRFKH